MPEYLAPGVYIVEVPTDVKPIPGVSTLSDAVLRKIIEDVRLHLGTKAPGWSDRSESDPGITLIELFAFLTEALLYRANLIPKRSSKYALRLALAALSVIPKNQLCCECHSKRVRFFDGRLLRASDFTDEQQYQRGSGKKGKRWSGRKIRRREARRRD